MQYSLLVLCLTATATANRVARLAARQAVTAAISPPGSPPPGCTPSASGSYAIVVQALNANAPAKRQVNQIPDGQAQVTHGVVSVISDGQVQAGPPTNVMMPIANQITDGQVQVQTTLAPVTELIDGQPQAPTVTSNPVAELADGQPQAPGAPSNPITQIADGQPQVPTATPVTAIGDGQPQALNPAASPLVPSPKMVACAKGGDLQITLANGVLTDALGRTGYIADNFQFQFDKPPQSRALYTAGWTFCGNGSLALGGSNVFYQCSSGTFYNIYDRDFAAQCSPIIINTLQLQQC